MCVRRRSIPFLSWWCECCGFCLCVSVKLVVKCPRSNLATIVQEVTTEWEIRAMPTFLFIKDGKQIDKIVGANKADLEKKCHYYATNQS